MARNSLNENFIFTNMEWTLFDKIIFIFACLGLALLTAIAFNKRGKAKDEVDENSNALYEDKDVLGQSKSWLSSEDVNDVPINISPRMYLILITIVMIVLLVVGAKI